MKRLIPLIFLPLPLSAQVYHGTLDVTGGSSDTVVDFAYRSDPGITLPTDISSSRTLDSISVTDQNPLPGKAFYSFEAVPPP